MKGRELIKSQIIDAWAGCIYEDYNNQRINSERSLQASLWSHLNKLLHKNNRQLFIEPSMKIKIDGKVKKVVPDIVVCNTREIISVIEIKYLPRGKANYKNDVRKLSHISKNIGKKICIANDRFRGVEMDETKYGLAKNVLFVWCGVHKTEKNETEYLYSSPYQSLNNCFMELHAATNVGSKPMVYERE